MRLPSVLAAAALALLPYSSSILGDPQKAGYTGSEQCISCHRDLHPEIVRGWEASPHHKSMRWVYEGETIPGNFDSNSVFRKEDVRLLIGCKGSQYIFIGNDFQVLPLSWSCNDSTWIKRNSGDAGRLCFGCHATAYFILERTFLEPGIGCEACHGPGRKHVESEGKKGTIVNPRDLPSDRNRMVCGQCHSIGKDPSGSYPYPVMNSGTDSLNNTSTPLPFQPGQDLTHGFIDAKPKVLRKGKEYSSLIQAPEYYAGQLCTDCHDPHGKTGNADMLIDTTSSLCLRCHGVNMTDLQSHWGADKESCWVCHEYVHTH